MIRTLQLNNSRPASYDRPYWVSYSSFHYSERQIRWVIENEECFEEGCWPREPTGEYITERYDRHERRWIDWIGCGSTVEAHRGKGSVSSEASFCKAKEIYGDVMQRIDKIGTHGKLLLAQLRAGYSSLDDEAHNALKYVCGNQPKKTFYSDWLRGRKNREANISKC